MEAARVADPRFFGDIARQAADDDNVGTLQMLTGSDPVSCC